jgi:hypothetical protein
MDTGAPPRDKYPSSETEAEKQRRIAHEAELIAEADAEIAAGLFIDSADVKVWIDSIGTDHELPVPDATFRLSLTRPPSRSAGAVRVRAWQPESPR